MRKYVVFFVVSLALMLAAISNSSASVAFPVIITDLNTTLVMAGWILTAFQLVQTIIMPLAGKLSDIFSRKAAFIVYTVLFTAGSILCALAPNVQLLIGARVIQAIGGGGFMPCAAGIVSAEFPESRQKYIGLFSSVFPFGAIIGPNLGGWMVEAFGWRSVFWVNVPIGILIILLSVLLLKKEQNGNTSIRDIDFAGAGLLFGSMSALMYCFTLLGDFETGIPWVQFSVFLGLSIILALLFIHRERRVKDPIIDLELLKKRPFMAANVYNLIYGVCALGVFSLIPLYAVSIYGMSTLESGVLLTPRSVAMMAASTLTSFSLVKWGYRKPILAGTLLVMVTMVLLALMALQPQGFSLGGLSVSGILVLYIVVGAAGIGHGTCTPAANNACIELMPEKVATITGLRGMFRSLGSTFGVAISTVVIHAMGDEKRAFFAVMLASAGLLVLIIPAIFMMPASPVPKKEKQK